MKVVGKGSANILIDYGDPGWLYRCSVRYGDSLKRNNEHSIQNMQYIQNSVKIIIGDLLCPMELIYLPLEAFKSVLSDYIATLDDTEVVVFKVPNLKPEELVQVAYADHFTQIYTSSDVKHVLLEFKPKWLHCSSDYCRNCTHSTLKGRESQYCYNRMNRDPFHVDELLARAGELPLKFKQELASYLAESNNVLAVLYKAQKELQHEPLSGISSIKEVSNSMSLAMTLRDVTCFIEWRSDADELRVNVVDVDLKPKEKFIHWRATQRELDNFNGKRYH